MDDLWPESLRPNVILVIADDMRKDSLPWMPKTLSAIASQGVNFTNAFSPHPICGPARASILSGLNSRQSGVFANSIELRAQDSIGFWLQQAGYTTGLFGKYLHQASGTGNPIEGWNEWQELRTYGYNGFAVNINGRLKSLPDTEYSTDYFAKQLYRFIRKNRNRPFLAVFAPWAGHAPYTPATRHETSLSQVDPPRGPNFREDQLAGKPSWVQFLKSNANRTTDEIIEIHRQQLRSLLALDDAVGKIDRALARFRLSDNTVVIFVSDQGILQGEHWSTTKFSAYEEAIQIPLAIRYPRRFPTPQSSDALVLTSDLAPTTASLTNVPLPEGRQGLALDALLAGSAMPREQILIESSGGWLTWPNRAIRTDRWKLIASRSRYSQGPFFHELYDLQTDPYELTNLFQNPGHEAIATSLQTALDQALPVN